MYTNRFITDPVKVVVYDPVLNKPRRTFCFLGDVPKVISNACINYQKQKNDKLLKDFYGTEYKKKLALNGTVSWTGASEYAEDIVADIAADTNNTDNTNNDYLDHVPTDQNIEISEYDGPKTGADEFDDIEELLKETPATPQKITRMAVSVEDLKISFEPGVEYITDVHFYPEDKFNELKEKIYISTGIPAYRQHLFYTYNGRLRTVYKIHADGIYPVDIRNITNYKDNINGIPIDKSLYDIRESLRVEALDMFNILGNALQDSTVFVVDLAQFTSPVHSQLVDIINDTYQFELFYYSFVIKYWPQLTRECFYDYIVSEPELQHKYPDLAKSKTTLASIYKSEREIIINNYRNINRSLAYADSGGVSMAITQMTAYVSGNKIMLNIRNIFDKLRVSKFVPEIHAYIEHGNKKYMLRKRHIRNGSDIQFPAGNLMKSGINIAISLRRSDQDSFHAKSSISTMENEQSRYLFLNIWTNGKCYVRTVWNEEDELGFEDIIKIMKKFTDPIITAINSLGRYAFISGNELPLITKSNIRYQGLNICVFWKKVMLESAFKSVRAIWDNYMKAKITAQRNVQQFDKYEFMFRKGMYEFDTGAIERIITASNNIALTNHYAHLSNNTIKQKWDQNYDGRIVRMSHRTTDVRFEISDIRENEFDIFYVYIISFIHHANLNIRAQPVQTNKDVKKLRKLREQDPELYNLKKYGSKKVYSIICQNQRQPLIYTPDEIKNMNIADVKKLTQYWNFTLNKPAYYGCPNKKYPHLSFMVNSHPRHYCLPCCNKKPQMGEDSKKTRVNSICMQKHKHQDDTTDAGISRHVMNYGKDIDLGRLSKLPQTSIKNLLFNTLPDPILNYYLYGVAQHVPAVENIGIIYAIAEGLGLPMEEFVSKMLAEIRKMKSIFNTLLNGTLVEYFHSMDDLITTIKELFIDMSMLTKEYQKFKQWPELFTELAHIIGINIITFIDEDGSGNADLFIPDIMRSEMLYVSRLNADMASSLMEGQKFIMVMKRSNRYYPIFVLDIERYFKVFEISSRNYTYDDKAIQIIYNMVKHDSRAEELNIEKTIDMILLKSLPGYKIHKKFINKQNLCYAVIIGKNKDLVYTPVNYSVHIPDEIEVSFSAFSRKDYDLKHSSLLKFITDVNSHIRKNYSVGGSTNLYSYKQLEINEYIKVADDVIGLTASGMVFYFTDKVVPETNKVRDIKYDYNVINQLIINRNKPTEDNRTKKIGESLYNNYLYQLFLIEFVNFLSNERNNTIRDKIIALINETNFKKDIGSFRKSLKALVGNGDYSIIQNQLVEFYDTQSKSQLLENIASSVYDFDRMTLQRLKSLPREELKAELTKIANTFAVQKDFDSTNVKFPNVYMPCSEMTDDTHYCDKDKLIINRDINEFVDILASDLMDDLKSKYLLNNLWMDTCIDIFMFERRPTEIITIYRLTE